MWHCSLEDIERTRSHAAWDLKACSSRGGSSWTVEQSYRSLEFASRFGTKETRHFSDEHGRCGSWCGCCWFIRISCLHAAFSRHDMGTCGAGRRWQGRGRGGGLSGRLHSVAALSLTLHETNRGSKIARRHAVVWTGGQSGRPLYFWCLGLGIGIGLGLGGFFAPISVLCMETRDP